MKLNLERFEFKGKSIFNDFNRYVKSSITNCSVVCCTVVLRILKRRDEQRRSTLYKGRKERSLLFENVHVAARKIAQQRKLKKYGRVNSSRVYF